MLTSGTRNSPDAEVIASTVSRQWPPLLMVSG